MGSLNAYTARLVADSNNNNTNEPDAVLLNIMSRIMSHSVDGRYEFLHKATSPLPKGIIAKLRLEGYRVDWEESNYWISWYSRNHE